MKLTLLLADAAQVSEGKLYILGGGWDQIGPQPTPFAVAMLIEVPWTETNRKHTLELELIDEDGNTVSVVDPAGGTQVMKFQLQFEVGRPPGIKAGSPLQVPQVLSFGPLPLKPGSRYAWQVSINGQKDPNWSTSSLTRPEVRTK